MFAVRCVLLTDGFDTAPFDRGVLDIRRADDSSLTVQTPMPGGAACCSTFGVLLSAVSVIGWPYLMAKTHLIRKVGVHVEVWSGSHRVVVVVPCLFTHARGAAVCWCCCCETFQGEIGLAEWNNGTIRVLTPGWHLLECVNTSVARFRITNDVIKHGAMKIIRVRPGFIGLGTLNGVPVLLQPGWFNPHTHDRPEA